LHNAQTIAANLLWVTKKRSRQPALRAFGKRLAGWRGSERTREEISLPLTALGAPLGGSTLAQYEKGTVWAPDPCVLWALATIYRRPLEELIAMLLANRADPNIEAFTDRDLAALRLPTESSSKTEARNRLRLLEDHLSTYSKALQQVREPVMQLRAIIDGMPGPEDSIIETLVGEARSAATPRNRQSKKKPSG
jgi:transcriptional regulator with XRE-family HTH domain